MFSKQLALHPFVWLVCLGVCAGVLLTLAFQHAFSDSLPTTANDQTRQSEPYENSSDRWQSSAQEAAPAGQHAANGQSVARPQHLMPTGIPTPALQDSRQSSYSYMVPAGTVEYTYSSGGCPVATGRRAVDSYVPGGGIFPGKVQDGAIVIYEQAAGSNVIIDPTPGIDVQSMPISRNGLLGNPCCDPPSVKGAAYNRSGY